MNTAIQEYEEILNHLTQIIDEFSKNKSLPKPDIRISREGKSKEELVEVIKQIGAAGPRVDGKEYLGQLFSGKNTLALVAETAANIYNIPMHTMMSSGINILIEDEVIRHIGGLIGFKDGIVCPGGSISNLTAMIVAKYRAGDSKEEGITKRYRVYASDRAHYSIIKNAGIIGIGRKNTVLVPSDEQGVMTAGLLEKSILADREKGYEPLMIISTAGTTLFGSFDDLVENSKVAEKYGLWHHVDGAFGGTLLLSQTRREKLRGIELCDSLTWDAHKMLVVPLTASVLLVKKKDVLNLLREDAEYLFSKESESGHKSIQCARRNDALKIWAVLSLGQEYVDDMIESQMRITEYAAQKIIASPDLELAVKPNLPLLCFRSKTKDVHELLTAKGIICNTSTFSGRKWVRISLINKDISEEHINNILEF